LTGRDGSPSGFGKAAPDVGVGGGPDAMNDARGAGDDGPLEGIVCVATDVLGSSHAQMNADRAQIRGTMDRSMNGTSLSRAGPVGEKKANKSDGQTLDERLVTVGRQTFGGAKQR